MSTYCCVRGWSMFFIPPWRATAQHELSVATTAAAAAAAAAAAVAAAAVAANLLTAGTIY